MVNRNQMKMMEIPKLMEFPDVESFIQDDNTIGISYINLDNCQEIEYVVLHKRLVESIRGFNKQLKTIEILEEEAQVDVEDPNCSAKEQERMYETALRKANMYIEDIHDVSAKINHLLFPTYPYGMGNLGIVISKYIVNWFKGIKTCIKMSR